MNNYSGYDSGFLESLGLLLIGVLFFSALIEVGILVYAYFNADEVSCNYLWCTFTTVRSSEHIDSSISSTSTTTRTCSENGVLINCSEIDKWMESIPK